jgi:hypothetical protein
MSRPQRWEPDGPNTVELDPPDVDIDGLITKILGATVGGDTHETAAHAEAAPRRAVATTFSDTIALLATSAITDASEENYPERTGSTRQAATALGTSNVSRFLGSTFLPTSNVKRLFGPSVIQTSNANRYLASTFLPISNVIQTSNANRYLASTFLPISNVNRMLGPTHLIARSIGNAPGPAPASRDLPVPPADAAPDRYPNLVRALREGRITGAHKPDPQNRAIRTYDDPGLVDEQAQIGFGRAGDPDDRATRRLRRR